MEYEINLLDYWRVILKRKKMVIFLVGAVTIGSVVASLLKPNIYKAEATLISLGGTKVETVLGGILGGLGGGGTSSHLITILTSRTLAERVVERYGLMKVFYQDLWDEKHQTWKVSNPKEMPRVEVVAKLLQSQMTFREVPGTQIIVVSAETTNPQLSATLVNDYIYELTDYLNENTLTTAKRNRVFIEGQLERNKAELLESGKELTKFYATNRISNVVPTLDVNVSMSKGVQGAAFGKETVVPKKALSVHDDRNAPGWLGVSTAYAGIQERAEEIQKRAEAVGEEIKKAKVVKDVPQQIYLQYLTFRRELLNQVNSLLSQQYEMAKIEEAKEGLDFQVIDWARVPLTKFKPSRRRIVMTAFVMSLFLAVFCAFCMDYLEKTRAKARQANP